jgi:hypothetical protein
MRLRHSCLVAAVAGIGFVSAAQATLSVSLVEVPLAAGAKTDDPQLGTLNNYPRSFQLQVTQGAGEHWSFASIQASLSGGHYYVPTTGDSNIGQDGVWNNVGARHLQNDTYTTTPDGGSHTTILGLSDYPANQTGAAVMPTSSNAANAIDVTWGDQQAVNSAKGDGTYTVASITVMGSGRTTLVGHVGGTQHNFTDTIYNSDSSFTGTNPFYIPLPMDFNNDGSSDTQDVPFILQVLTGQTYTGVNNPLFVGDLNGDGSVDTQDVPAYLSILTGGGATASELSALSALVPEPTSLGLLGCAAIGMLRRRRK